MVSISRRGIIYSLLTILFFVVLLQVYYIVYGEAKLPLDNSNVVVKKSIRSDVPEVNMYHHHKERDTQRHRKPDNEEEHIKALKKLEEEREKIRKEKQKLLERKDELNKERIKGPRNVQADKTEDIATANENLNVHVEASRKMLLKHHLKTYKHKKDLLLHPVLLDTPLINVNNTLIIHGASSYLGMMATLYFSHFDVSIIVVSYEEEEGDNLDKVRHITLRERLSAVNDKIKYFDGCDKIEKDLSYYAVLDFSKKHKLCETFSKHKSILDLSGGKIERDDSVVYRARTELPQIVGPYDESSMVSNFVKEILEKQTVTIPYYKDEPIEMLYMGARDWIMAVQWMINELDAFPIGKTKVLNFKFYARQASLKTIALNLMTRLNVQAEIIQKNVEHETKPNRGPMENIPAFEYVQKNVSSIVSDYIYWYTEYHFPTTLVTSTYLTNGRDPQRNVKYSHSDPEKMMNYYRSIHALEHPLVVIILYDEHSSDFIRNHESAVFRFKKVTAGSHRNSLNDDRFWLFKDLLNSYLFEDKHLTQYRPHYFMFTDLFDVKFNKNPVELMAAEPNTIYVGRDVQDVLGRNSWIRGVVNNCKIHDLLEQNFTPQMVNPGLFGASVENAMALLNTVIELFEGLNRNENCNMPIFNMAIQKLLKEKNIPHHHGAPFGSPFTKFSCTEEYYLCHK